MEQIEKNCILIDWFAVTTRQWEPIHLIDYLGLDLKQFQSTYGLYGYRDRLMYNGISIHYNLRSDPEDDKSSVMLEMSGQGCRQYETSSKIGFMPLFCDVSNGDLTIKRLDIAYDDVDQSGGDGLLDLKKIAYYTLHQRFVTKWNGGQVLDKFSVNGNNEPMTHALTVQFGSRQSAIMLRIYDKAQERGGLEYHWVRSEIVFKEERAKNFIEELLKGKSIGELYAGVLRNYLRFIKSDHTRRERCTIVTWWKNFLGSAEKVKLYSVKDVDYNLARIEKYIFEQAGNSTLTYLLCQGEEKLMTELEKRKAKLNENQRRLIEEYTSGV
ncbi:MAG: replication initiation factor domain-containing protein [[Eubacterium] siraeum]|nr:replication initiation factor domain-containing protein [[Eubacterium] siraeum]